MNKPVVFSGFDGISGGRIALERAGITPSLYYSSELLRINGKPNPAIRITTANYPDTILLNDICGIDGWAFRGLVDIFLGGSPCQSFSNAGIRNGFHGTSKLFFEWLRLKNIIQPKYWLLENVVMKKEWQNMISKYLGVEPIFINSSVASGQSRPRLYWTNIPYTPIEDHGILLGDVVLGGLTGAGKHGKLIPEHLRIPGGHKWKNNGWEFNPDNKAYCLVTSRGKYKNIQGLVVGYTPEDAEALQTLPIGYTNVPGISNTERFKAIGNGWTVDVLVEAFFKNLPWASELKVQPKGKFCKL